MESYGDHGLRTNISHAQPNLELALRVHTRLTELIKPATVGSIRVSSIAHNRSLKIISLIGIFFLVLMVASSILLSAADIEENARSSAWKYIAIISAAVVGSSFYSLYTARDYLRNGTFDPNLQQDYIVRFALGILAGFILANIPEVFSVTEAPSDPRTNAIPAQNTVGDTQGDTDSPTSPNLALEFGEVTLAFVGGFLPRVVYLILTRIGDSLAAVFDGRGTERARAEAERAFSSAISGASTEIDRILASMDAGEITPADARAEIRRVMNSSTLS